MTRRNPSPRPRAGRAINPDLNRAAEDRVVTEVKLGRALAAKMTTEEWLAAVATELARALDVEKATLFERNALALALHSPSSEPASIMQRAHAKRELPCYVAGHLSSWVNRQRPAYRASLARTEVPATMPAAAAMF